MANGNGNSGQIQGGEASAGAAKQLVPATDPSIIHRRQKVHPTMLQHAKHYMYFFYPHNPFTKRASFG